MFESNKMQQPPHAHQPVDAGSASAFLGKGAKLIGKICLDGPARIEGHIEGEIEAKDALTIGEDAVVKAKVVGSVVIVHGTVNGDIVAKTRLEIRSPGRVHGNISTATLVIQEGTVFEGSCSMNEDARAKIKIAAAPVAEMPKAPEPLASALR